MRVLARLFLRFFRRICCICCRGGIYPSRSLSKNAVGAGLCSARGRLPCEKLSRKSVATSGRRAEQSPAPTNPQQRRYSYPGVRWFFDSLGEGFIPPGAWSLGRLAVSANGQSPSGLAGSASSPHSEEPFWRPKAAKSLLT